MADDTTSDPQQAGFTARIRRSATGLWSAGRGADLRLGLRERWRSSAWFRRAGYALGAVLVIYALAWVTVLRGLPSTDMLINYQPPLPTMVRGIDGEIVSSYARDRRVQLRYVDIPQPVIHAFLAAEDKNFFSHSGVDYGGLAQAVADYVLKIGSGRRARGGSTITQQVAKNILIGNEYSVGRKFKEMILARRIEGVLTKEQILELYLNQIALGRRSFGIQAASRAYFSKDVGELDISQAAFLAILPKAPETYSRARFEGQAVERRNWVLDQMVRNGWASRGDADAAKARPLGLVNMAAEADNPDAGYFLEEVRRQLIDQFGETSDDGDHSVYAGGLWVRTSLDTKLQTSAQDALRAELVRFSGGRGWHGPIKNFDISSGNWQTQLVTANLGIHYQDWRVGIVIEKAGTSGKIGFVDGSSGPLVSVSDQAKPGDVIAVAPAGAGFAMRLIPEVSGGMVVQDPQNGRVEAMQGGFDARLGAFNRATQALRQPGSTIKPFVYATALDYGMTPSSMVEDGTFCVYQGAALGQKCFKNFGNEGGSGQHTMRWGLEQSRNLMTVRIANDTGMEHVVHTIKKVGIGDYQPYLSMALGAGDTTVGRMVNAYAAIANQGRQHAQTLIDYVEDRDGKVIWRADERPCEGCKMPEWDGKAMPRVREAGQIVMDPRTAFQVEHMLEGVVTRGTAVILRDIDLPLFGKTGTTSGPTNVWFVGGTPQLIAGVYIGFDQPRSLGGYAQGGRIAAPVFKQFLLATRDRWSDVPAPVPKGVRMVKVDRVSGHPVFAGTPANRDPKASIIWEAFKPEAAPEKASLASETTVRQQVLAALRSRLASRRGSVVTVPGKQEEGGGEEGFVETQGGVY